MRVRTLLNPFSCIQRFTKQVWTEIFPDFQGTLDVEIGSGSGSFLTQYAEKNPTRSVVGLEIRFKLTELTEKSISDLSLKNAKIFYGNGKIGLEDMFDDESIDRVFIFHPDPWPKSRHKKRRLVNEAFIELVYKKLKPTGKLYISTDVVELWHDMVDTVNETKRFQVDQDEEFWTNNYNTRWHEMSQEQNRTLSYGTFKKVL